MGKHVVVIGGGVVGLSCATYLQAAGHTVIVLDRGNAGSERCSSGNSGLIVPSHFVPLASPGMVSYGLRQMFNPRSPFRIKPQMSPELAKWVLLFWRATSKRRTVAAGPVLRDLNLLSRKLYLDLANDYGFQVEQRGLLMVCRDPAALQEEAHLAERARSLGLQAEVLSSSDLKRVDPSVEYRAVGGVWFPQDCSVDPLEITTRLRERIESIRYGVEATGFVKSGNVVSAVATSEGIIEGDAFVIAGGVWSSRLAGELKTSLPMQAGKGYSITLEDARTIEVPSILVEGRVALTPMGSRLRVGGTMELAGIDESVDRRRVQGIVDTLCAYIPSVQASRFKDAPVWKGLRPCSPDGLPYIGPLSRFPNVFAATGHAMMGLSLAPVTGHLIAQHVSGKVPEVGSSLLSPDRF